MPVLFNTNQPASQAQLDQLYTGNPNLSPSQVDSNLFLQNSQAQEFAHKQAAALGIGDPVEYYQRAALARQMAAAPSGAQMNAQQMSGQFSPNSLPGQLAYRNAMADRAAAISDADKQQLAALQQQNNDRYYPLPTEGAAMPTLSPVAQAAMAQQGIKNPLQFIMQQRLGGDRRLVDTSGFPKLTTAGINPDDLYGTPSFQAAMTKDPQAAGRVAHALTGIDLGTFAQDYHTSLQKQEERGIAALAGHLDRGEAVIDPTGNLQWREMQFDPMANRYNPTGKLVPPNGYQISLAKYLPKIDKKLGRFQQLGAAGPATPPVAALQNVTDQMPSHADAMATQNGPSEGWLADTMRGAITSTGDLFSGRMSDPNYGQSLAARAFNAPTGSAIQHAAPILRNNPQFQELMRRDPAKARQMILALQMRGQAAPMQPTIPMLNPDPNSYPFGE